MYRQQSKFFKRSGFFILFAFLLFSGCTKLNEPQPSENDLKKSSIPWEGYAECYPNPLSPYQNGSFTVGGQPTTCVKGYCDKPHGKCVCEAGWAGRYCQIPPKAKALSATQGDFEQYLIQYENGVKTKVTATTYGGGYGGGSCGYKVCEPGQKIGDGNPACTVLLPASVDGIAAVNTMLYGPQYGNQYGSAPNGKNACGQCYQLTRGSISKIVTVVDRCGGGCWSKDSECTKEGGGSISGDCNWCLEAYCNATTDKHGNPFTYNTQTGAQWCQPNPVCSAYQTPQMITAGANATESTFGGYCDNARTVTPDWCQANDHPHFDLDPVTLDALCPGNNGSCQIDKMKAVDCNWQFPTDPASGGPIAECFKRDSNSYWKAEPNGNFEHDCQCSHGYTLNGSKTGCLKG